jgi:hypothetical protein
VATVTGDFPRFSIVSPHAFANAWGRNEVVTSQT